MVWDFPVVRGMETVNSNSNQSNLYFIAVFNKISAISVSSNVRFVAINRRGYAGSTKYSDDEARVVLGGSDEEKEVYIASRGSEILSFIDTFIRQNRIPPAEERGGVILLGWSIGTFPILSALSQIDSLGHERQELLQSYIKSVILHG
jgi:pimeloyl-ACP methyl ester carboxylesterase